MSGNMMAVASYGDKDYYKCKYCRYVAPFASIISQNYSKTYYNETLHKCVNNVNGLEYVYFEDHKVEDYECVDCGGCLHNYTYENVDNLQHNLECIICGYTKQEYHGEYTYTSYSSTSHKCTCKCGYERFSAHKVKSGGGLIQRCVDCGALVNLNDNFGQIQSVGNGITYITDNGSFVRGDGIIVLSEIDYLLYINGELDIDSLVSQGAATH